MIKLTRKITTATIIFTLFSCTNPIQKPTQEPKNEVFEKSKQWAKDRENQEKNYIQQWIQKNDKTFVPTKDGFWIKYIIQNENPKAKALDRVKYTAQISDIEGNIIYTFKEFGVKTVILTKSQEIRAIEKALFLMAEQEKTILLATSFNGYGVYGDENKIGSNLPIKIELQMLKVN